MPTVHPEVEAKYDVDPGYQVPGLVELFGPVRGTADDAAPWAEGESGEHQLGSTYFDTSRLDLAAAGLTLRRRTGGDDAGWHLKVPAGDGSRSEVRVPLGDAGSDREDVVPDELVELTYARTRGRPLVPVARVDTRRTVRRLVDATGRVLVELADDRVTARRLYPAAGSGDAAGAPTSWREVEVEVVDGPPDLLAAADPVLRERGMAPAAAASKLARTLGVETLTQVRAAPPDGTATGSGTAGEVVLAAVAELAEGIRAQDLPVRLRAPDAVHAMRVVTRRLRSVLKTFEPVFHGAQLRPVRQELRWLAAVLGTARDAEVVRDRVGSALGEPGQDVGHGTSDHAAALVLPGAAEVCSRLDDAHRAAYDDVLAALGGARYRGVLAALDALVEQPPLRKRAGRPADRVLPRLVRRAYADVRTAMTAAGEVVGDPAGREEALHEARKAAKRARYAAESIIQAFGTDASRFAGAMERLQDALGEHIDAVSTRRRLAELAAQTSLPAAAFACGRLHALEEVRAEEAMAEVDAAWPAARRRRLREWFR